jgi:hypothetical protein
MGMYQRKETRADVNRVRENHHIQLDPIIPFLFTK